MFPLTKRKEISVPTSAGMNSSEYEIILGDNVKVTEDKRTKTRVANFPFDFADGTRGIMILCRVKDESWQPNKTIRSIKILFA